MTENNTKPPLLKREKVKIAISMDKWLHEYVLKIKEISNSSVSAVIGHVLRDRNSLNELEAYYKKNPVKKEEVVKSQ